MDVIFSRCSSGRPEKRGIVFKFLIIYNSPVNVRKQFKKPTSKKIQ